MNSYTKLKSGEWGIRAQGLMVKAGDSVTVTKKDGSVKTEHVARIVWSGNGVSLCAIGHGQHSTTAGRGYRRSDDDDMVKCRHCGKMTMGGDDWCQCCGRGDYER